jgi:hypothetical protein
MRQLQIVTVLTAVAIVGFLLELLRRRQLQEKYGILWVAVGVLLVPMAVWPGGLDSVARLLGIASGVSLVLFGGLVFLLLVCMHLSWEVSRLEEETRTLAEEVALIRTERDLTK